MVVITTFWRRGVRTVQRMPNVARLYWPFNSLMVRAQRSSSAPGAVAAFSLDLCVPAQRRTVATIRQTRSTCSLVIWG